jgi:hypothetical protein
MNRWVFKAACAVVLASGSFSVSLVQAAEGANDALLACARETDDARRLRCFDAVVADLRRAPAVPAASVAATPSAATAASAPAPAPVASISREDKFGARGDLDKEKREELQEITGRVTEIGARPHGELVLTLDNGQVWAERTANSKVKVKVGDTVKIEAGALGSFKLIAPNGRSSKVARVR